jgi:hypothetical protein
MMFKIILFFLLPFYLDCVEPQQNGANQSQNIVFQAKDKEILEQVFELFKDDKNTPVTDLMVKVGSYFKGTPYVASTLEINPDDERLIVNLREMDCTTFAENVLAISRAIKDGNPTFEKFAAELQKIRYRNGEIDGYTSRNHYFSDWIFENDRSKILKSVSKEIAKTLYPKKINFMSTHPESYRQLKENKELINAIAGREKAISSRETYFIPKEKIEGIEAGLMDGDIIGITSNVAGLDISHVGILVRKSGRMHLMHASTIAKKVVVSEETLTEYLMNGKSVSGIMVARPQ